VIASKASDWDVPAGLGWVGVHVDVNGGSYGTNANDGFVWTTSPVPAFGTPANDPALDWFEPEFDDSGWSATPSGAAIANGQHGFPDPTPAEKTELNGKTAWLRFVVPNPAI
jgi:hypothetical protein